MNLMLYNFIILFCGMIKLYILICRSWCDMHLITPILYFDSFHLEMTCSFFIVSDIYEEKTILWHQKNVTQCSGFSIIIFVWVILYSAGTYFSCYYFLLERKSICPCFPRFFIQFSKCWVLEMNQLKSWVYLQIGNLEF